MSFDPKDLLQDLSEPYKDNFMRTCYANMVKDPQMLKSQNFSMEVQCNALNIIMKYFENLEEYEKCYDLKKMKEKILKGDNLKKK